MSERVTLSASHLVYTQSVSVGFHQASEGDLPIAPVRNPHEASCIFGGHGDGRKKHPKAYAICFQQSFCI